MTLIIALACKNGIVMASDSQVTVISAGGPVRQMGTKIKEMGKATLWSGSGEVGFIQKIEKAIEDFPDEDKNSDLEKIRSKIVIETYKIRKDSLDRSRSLYGKNGEKRASAADLIFASYVEKKPKILHITHDVKDEELQEFGYGASGIGDTFAYTLLKDYAIKNCSIEEAEFLAYMVIKETIRIGAYGLGGPIQIWVIKEFDENGKKIIKSHKLSEEEIKGLEDTYISWKEAENEILKNIIRK